MAGAAQDVARTVESALLSITNPADTAALTEGTRFMKAFMNKRAAAPTLLTLLASSENVSVRNLSAVFFRRKAVAFYGKCSAEAQSSLKASLLARLGVEPARLVRKGLVSIIAALSKTTLRTGEWPELIAALAGCAASPAAEMRELGMLLLKELALSDAAVVADAMATVKPWIGAALVDASSARVRAEGLLCVAIVMKGVDVATYPPAVFGDILPVMVKVCEGLLAAHEEEEAVASTIDTIHELVACDSPLVQPLIVPLANFFLAIFAAPDCDDGLRKGAAEALTGIVEHKPLTFHRKGLLETVRKGQRGRGAHEGHSARAQREERGLDLGAASICCCGRTVHDGVRRGRKKYINPFVADAFLFILSRRHADIADCMRFGVAL